MTITALLERHERRAAQRRVEAVGIAQAEVTGGAALVEAGLLDREAAAAVVGRRARENLRVEVHAPHDRQGVLEPRSERVRDRDLAARADARVVEHLAACA